VRRVNVLLLLVLAVPALADGPVSRMFVLKHRPAGEAVSVVEPLLSPEGSMMVRPRDNSLTVVDDAATLARVAAAIARFDAAPASFKVRVRLVRASTQPPGPGSVTVDLSGLPSGLLPYTSFREVGGFEAVTMDGGYVSASAGATYAVNFGVHVTPGDDERVQLVRFELGRREGQSPLPGVENVRPLLRSTVSLLIGQTFVMVATPSEGAGEALLLVVVAERAGAAS
jgi:hypothetical protein